MRYLAVVDALARRHPTAVHQPAHDGAYFGLYPEGTGDTPLHVAAAAGELACCRAPRPRSQ